MTLLLTYKTNPSFPSDSFIVLGETLFYSSPLHVHLVPYRLLKASQGTYCCPPAPSDLCHCRLCSKTDHLFPLQHLSNINLAFLLQLTAPWLSARKSYIAFSSFWILSFHKDDPGQIMFTLSGKAKNLEKYILHLLNIFSSFLYSEMKLINTLAEFSEVSFKITF